MVGKHQNPVFHSPRNYYPGTFHLQLQEDGFIAYVVIETGHYPCWIGMFKGEYIGHMIPVIVKHIGHEFTFLHHRLYPVHVIDKRP